MDFYIVLPAVYLHFPPLGSHLFQATKAIFKLIQYIIRTNLMTKFYYDRKINVTSRVFTRKIAPPPIGMNLLNEFHEDRIINVASRVNNTPSLGGHVFQGNVTIFELIQDIIKANLLTRKNAPPPGGHVFQPTGIIFELVQDIIRINFLTKFHEDWTINVASRVLIRLENGPSLGSHVFQAKVTIFKLIQDISGTNLLDKFHEDVAFRVLTRFHYSHLKEKCPAPGGHVFQPTGIIFQLGQDIIGMNLLTKFYKNQTINVASRVHISHVFQANVTIFELIQDIIETNLLTKFHEDWTINVASRELTKQMLTPHNGQRTTDKIVQKSSS
ncbi:hypothetical protein DPMN_164649 [Dreissena polymorpha]|uniref:Uncharacterized protein n=1 Tax=Dreissena polymorpha TaxID=45954 RepID=A0A9D4EZ44_DREPO|nr:hypothetical protein DPMN_164649 [Dreissena polymorpha]